MQQPPQGVILGSRPSDFIVGANSPIPFESRNSTRDWRQFRSRDERQNFKKFDAYDCTNMSVSNQWESQANWALVNNLWPSTALAFWNKHKFIVDGKFEVSDRFNAKLSGTDPKKGGNYVYKGHDVLRNQGVVPEWMWPAGDELTVDEFYKEIPQEVLDVGKSSLEHYTWLNENLASLKPQEIDKQLEHAPIQVVLYPCPPWNGGGVVPVCPNDPIHVVLLDDIEDSNFTYNIFDHYDPFAKKLAAGYKIYSATKGILYPKGGKYRFEHDLVSGQVGLEVMELQKVLKADGQEVTRTGVYDSQTIKAVFEYQKKYNVASWWELLVVRGRRVGPKTRAQLNK